MIRHSRMPRRRASATRYAMPRQRLVSLRMTAAIRAGCWRSSAPRAPTGARRRSRMPVPACSRWPRERRAAEDEAAARKLAAAQAEADAVRKQAEKLAAAESEAIEQRRNSWSGRLKSVLTTAIGATSGAFLGNVGSRAGEAAAEALFNSDGHHRRGGHHRPHPNHHPRHHHRHHHQHHFRG
jgi:hypothetical protein